MRHTDVLGEFQARTRESIEAFTEWLEVTRAPLNAEQPLQMASWADRFLTDVGYYNELRKLDKAVDVAENRVRNLKDLIATLDGIEPGAKTPGERLLAFLEDITLDADKAEEKESAGDAVTLITMHSCKGLEYPHVFIVGLEDGLLPHSRSKVEGTLDEERRLFYVAITRAKQTLSISHCAGRKKYGSCCVSSIAVLEGTSRRTGRARRRPGERTCEGRHG